MGGKISGLLKHRTMTRSIPKINIDFASTLPLIIANALYKGNAGSPIFTHVKIGIDIDFYCFKPNWELLIWKIDDKSINDEEGNPLTWKTVEPFLKDYSRGFQDGYFEFDNLLKEGQYFQNDEIKARKIFEYSNSWRSGPFREQAGNGNPGTYITKDLWYEDGREAGYFYKSWQIIVENHEMFIGYFSEQTQLPKERQIADESEKKTRTTEKKNKRKPPKSIKQFPEYLHKDNWQTGDNVEAAEFLRDRYAGQKGKTIACMIRVLTSIHVVNYRSRKELYRSIEKYFGKKIGSSWGIDQYMDVPDEDKDYQNIRVEILKESLFQ